MTPSRCGRSATGQVSFAQRPCARPTTTRVAYAAVTEAAEKTERAAALGRASDPPLAIAEAAAEVGAAAAEIAAAGTWPFTPDAIVACELAAAAARGAAGLVAANLSGSNDPRAERARDAAGRAAVRARPGRAGRLSRRGRDRARDRRGRLLGARRLPRRPARPALTLALVLWSASSRAFPAVAVVVLVGGEHGALRRCGPGVRRGRRSARGDRGALPGARTRDDERDLPDPRQRRGRATGDRRDRRRARHPAAAPVPRHGGRLRRRRRSPRAARHASPTRGSREALLLSGVAALGFGGFFVGMNSAVDSADPFWALLVARAAAAALLVAVLAACDPVWRSIRRCCPP